MTGVIDWEQLYTLPAKLISCHYPRFIIEILSSRKSEQSEHEYIRERELVLDAFDQRLRELDSPWLRMNKDKEDEDKEDEEVEECDYCIEDHPIDGTENLASQLEGLMFARMDARCCEKFLTNLEAEVDKQRQENTDYVSSLMGIKKMSLD